MNRFLRKKKLMTSGDAIHCRYSGGILRRRALCRAFMNVSEASITLYARQYPIFDNLQYASWCHASRHQVLFQYWTGKAESYSCLWERRSNMGKHWSKITAWIELPRFVWQNFNLYCEECQADVIGWRNVWFRTSQDGLSEKKYPDIALGEVCNWNVNRWWVSTLNINSTDEMEFFFLFNQRLIYRKQLWGFNETSLFPQCFVRE